MFHKLSNFTPPPHHFPYPPGRTTTLTPNDKSPSVPFEVTLAASVVPLHLFCAKGWPKDVTDD